MSTEDRRHGGSGHAGTMVLATILGVGVGLLAAPSPGSDTRRVVRKRLADAREGIGDGLEELEERSRPARRALRERADQLRTQARRKYEEKKDDLEEYVDDLGDEFEDADGGSSALGILAIGAGLAAAAFLITSERAAPARERVREAAATVRDEAETRWDRFQQRRGNSHRTTGTGTRSGPDSAPQAN